MNKPLFSPIFLMGMFLLSRGITHDSNMSRIANLANYKCTHTNDGWIIEKVNKPMQSNLIAN